MLYLLFACAQEPTLTDTADEAGFVTATINPETDRVAQIEPSRYLGDWYEQAAVNIGPQARCTGTKANYSLADDGTIVVLNSCFLDSLDGQYNEVEGSAEAVDDSFSHLLVTFFGSFSANYYVYDADGKTSEAPYEWAVVTSDGGAIWVLTREQNADAILLEDIYARLDERGIDSSTLKRTLQPE